MDYLGADVSTCVLRLQIVMFDDFYPDQSGRGGSRTHASFRKPGPMEKRFPTEFHGREFHPSRPSCLSVHPQPRTCNRSHAFYRALPIPELRALVPAII